MKIIKIEGCNECFHPRMIRQHFVTEPYLPFRYCLLADEDGENRRDINEYIQKATYPDWCPLEDLPIK